MPGSLTTATELVQGAPDVDQLVAPWVKLRLETLRVPFAENTVPLSASASNILVEGDRIWLDDRIVDSMPSSGKLEPLLSLRQVLTERRKSGALPAGTEPGPAIQFWFDGQTPANVAKSVIYAAASAGYCDGLLSVRKRGPAGYAAVSIKVPFPFGPCGAPGGVKRAGTLPKEVIQRVVRGNFDSFSACYDDGLKRDPLLQGRVTIHFLILEDGSVAHAMWRDNDTLRDTPMLLCLLRRFEQLHFPKPIGGVVPVGYPLMFSPEEQ